MHITRKVILENDPSTYTVKDLMDGLVALDIGFIGVDDAEYGPQYYWQPEGLEEPAYAIGVTNTTTGWDVTWGNQGANLYVWNPKLPIVSRTASNIECSISSWFPRQAPSTYITIDYIKFGNSIMFTGSSTQYPATQVKYGFIEPKSEEDSWYLIDVTYVHSRDYLKTTGSQRPFNLGGNDAAGGIPTACRIGKFYDMAGARFADNLHIATLRPIMWEFGFCEVEVSGRRFLLVAMTNGEAICPAFDITEYIEEG